MRIAVFHQYYLAAGAPGGSRFNEFARLWCELGHEVTVITGMVNYTTGEARPEHAGRWIVRESDGPVDVWRCWVPPTYQKSRLGRSFGYFGWVASAATAALQIPKPDVIIATSPPLTAALPGYLAARLPWRDVPWVFEIRDLWPESLVGPGMLQAESPLVKLLYGLERFACTRSDAVNVLTPAFRENLVRRGLCPDAKIAFVPNGADVRLFAPAPRDNAARREFGWGDRTVALYAGAHGIANGLDQLVEAAALLKNRPDILLATVGDGNQRARLDGVIRDRGITNLVMHGPQPKDRMPEVVNASDIGLAVLQRTEMFKTVYPNKVFDYMACERPTVIAIDGVARELVCEQAGAGLFATPEDPRAIADAVIALADDPAKRAEMGARGRAWVLANATRDALARRYLDVLRAAIDRRAAR